MPRPRARPATPTGKEAPHASPLRLPSQMVNPNADAATQKGQALMINTNAAKGLAEVGPRVPIPDLR